MQYEHSKSQQVKTHQRLWQALIVASQATKPRHSGKRALSDPARCFSLCDFTPARLMNSVGESLCPG
jgi:hypothetical protein